MASIEQTLVRETRLSAAELTRASVRCQEMGGRLETAVLELGLLTEAELAPALAAHYRLPHVGGEDLREISDSVRALLSPQQAGAYRVIPFAAGPGRADLATTGDLDLERADELAFLLGRRVRLFVCNEVRIAQALHRLYGQRQAARLLNVADRLDRGLGPSSDLADDVPHPAESPAPEPVPGTPFGTIGASGFDRPSPPVQLHRRVTPPKPREVLKTISLTDEEREAIFGSGRAPALESHPTVQVPASELAKLSHDLQAASSPTAVGQAFLDYLQSFFAGAILLRPEGELFRGWMARGPNVDPGELRQLITGPGLAAEWRELLADQDAVTTSIGPSAEASGLTSQLGLETGSSLTLVPIRVQGRVVSLAVGALERELERSERELLGNASLRTGLALQSWILRQKHHASEPS